MKEQTDSSYKGIYSTRPECPNCGQGALIGRVYGHPGVTTCDACGSEVEFYVDDESITRSRNTKRRCDD